jgi:hypothetical protein
MSPKIKPEHLARTAIVYVRQSSIGQVEHNTESQRRQYSLADTAAAMGFASVQTIDDDLGRSGSGLVEGRDFKSWLRRSAPEALARSFALKLHGSLATGATGIT